MSRIVLGFSLLLSAITLTGCTYDQASCTSSSCGYVATTSYVPTTTYVKKTTYVPTYTSNTCCSTCNRCNYNYDYYGTYNTGWY